MECLYCRTAAPPAACSLRFCVRCIRDHPRAVLPLTMRLHARSRLQFGLPASPPRHDSSVKCPLCMNECQISPQGLGYCGLRTNTDGKLLHRAGTAQKGLLSWYYDPPPANCVADWVCPGHAQRGKKNLAVFYTACSLDCLFCQNWRFRYHSLDTAGLSARELAACVDEDTFCICLFGGDPTPQMPHALATARQARHDVRICWETNGTLLPRLLQKAIELSLATGGCIKFDLKVFDEDLHLSLTSASNQRTLENLALAASFIPRRREPPLLIASASPVPGYVDAREAKSLAEFLTHLDLAIPYALLAYHPHFYAPTSDAPRESTPSRVSRPPGRPA